MNNEIMVFASNLSGIHGAGSAKAAYKKHGATWGKGSGFSGRSYAIPTKDGKLQVLPLSTIKEHINKFIKFAKNNKNMTFNVVKVGCGLAGYMEYQIAPLFVDAPENCNLPEGWREYGNRYLK